MGRVGGDAKTELPRATINMEARADVAAWAYALHVTEQDLTDAVAKVGNHARAVITYILKRAERPARPDGMTGEARRQASRRRREGAVKRRSEPR
jgi:3-oxoacyl-[acyl-carrier-protein] synthase III